MNRLFITDARPPIYVSAGFAKEQTMIEHLAEEETLAMQILGSYSMYGNPGYDGTVFYWDEETQAAYNCVGLRNPGHKAASEYLPNAIKKMHDYGQLALISTVALPGEDPYEYLPQLAEWGMEMGADGVEADLSCPNVKGVKICDTVDTAYAVTCAIRRRIGEDATLSLKVGAVPDLTASQYQDRAVPADYIDTINAKEVAMPRDPETGKKILSPDVDTVGMSGPAISALSRENLKRWASKTSYHVLSVGGVVNGEDVFDRTEYSGADLAGFGQALHRVQDPRRFLQQIATEYIDACY